MNARTVVAVINLNVLVVEGTRRRAIASEATYLRESLRPPSGNATYRMDIAGWTLGCMLFSRGAARKAQFSRPSLRATVNTVASETDALVNKRRDSVPNESNSI